MFCRTTKKKLSTSENLLTRRGRQPVKAGARDRGNRYKQSISAQQQNAHRHQKTTFISQTGQARLTLAM